MIEAAEKTTQVRDNSRLNTSRLGAKALSLLTIPTLLLSSLAALSQESDKEDKTQASENNLEYLFDRNEYQALVDKYAELNRLPKSEDHPILGTWSKGSKKHSSAFYELKLDGTCKSSVMGRRPQKKDERWCFTDNGVLIWNTKDDGSRSGIIFQYNQKENALFLLGSDFARMLTKIDQE